jgi:MFS family permease
MEKNHRLFVASIIAIATTSFGFIVRAFLISEWGVKFNLTDTQIGALQGAGLFPFALSIIVFSLFIDRIGYGRAMMFAWVGHVVSAVITMTASSYTQLYVGTLVFALANGVVEAVTNPVVATMFPRDKTKYLNMLHAGWPGGLVLGGVLFIALGSIAWQAKIGLFLLPALVYGGMMLGCKFPVQERVAAGVSYDDMLKEFGWAGCFIVSYFMAGAFDAVAAGIFHTSLPTWAYWAIAIVPTLLFLAKVRTFGRPMFVFMLLVMVLLATTELGTDSWVSALMTPVLSGNFGANAGNWVLVYTSAIMFALRFFAGPLVHKLSPLGLLAVCALMASAGLYFLANAGAAAGLVFLAATLYGVGKSFFWPTTLGVVSEQFPRGGALTLNAMGGMGMIAVGVLGAPFLGALQDKSFDHAVQAAQPAAHAAVAGAQETHFTMSYRPLDRQKISALPAAQQTAVEKIRAETNQSTLAKFAVLPLIMAVCYGALLLVFKARGGYKPVELATAGNSDSGQKAVASAQA